MKKTLPDIQIGSQWVMVERNPWAGENPVVVTVTDVKAGWVRYKIGSGLFSDSVEPLADFLNRHSPAPSDWPEGIEA